ncbi:hypothetical protein EGC82_16340 [Shewanella livingstonensis]|uniref:Polysaccharide pyruvyl transferase domain-containing protein n=1 Tax=Shewanella livingstonensis TaxID=150120 RepID=A0A3G8LZ86_9GAMM|nr:polysaccharide pyruvyl transferase family protein [Shewanella livingstonensis]AZG74182.1 hypothetical protein EGC82_16340 [Shewanella livingstonensis]
MSVSLLLISETNEQNKVINAINSYSSQCDQIMVLHNNYFYKDPINTINEVSSINEFVEKASSDTIVITRVGYELDIINMLNSISSKERAVGALYVDNYIKDEMYVSIDTYVEARLPILINTSFMLKKQVFESFDILTECDVATFEKIILARAFVAGEVSLVSNRKKVVNVYHEINMYDVTSSNILHILKSDLILIEEEKLLKGKQFQKLVDFIKLFSKLKSKKVPNKLNILILKAVLQNIGILKYLKNDIIGTVGYYLKDIINLINHKYLKKEDVLFSFFTSKYPVHMNWGDDINYFILSKATNKKIVKLNRISFGDVILPIGSIIQFIPKNIKVNIYGAGLISNNAIVNKNNIGDILFVRGPNTRKRLIELGLYVPESYGDLGLLISDYYKPKIDKKFNIGFIPHYTEKNSDFTLHCKKLGIKIINVQQGHEEFIDDLLSCENIISSSLHGLIASDSYLIPNKWIKVSDRVLGDGFKFDDYHLGTLAKDFMSYTPDCTESVATLISLCSEKHIDEAEIVRVKKQMQKFLHNVC